MLGDDFALDGELYNHEYRENFEELTSKIRKATPQPGNEVVQYWIYDVVAGVPFELRMKVIEDIERAVANDALDSTRRALGVLSTFEVEDGEAMVDVVAEFIAQGYEGGIVRNARTPYEHKRSYGLQKVKTFLDDEFEIVRVEEGKGKLAAHAIFVCATPGGEEFGCKMQGELDELARVWTNRDGYVGRQLTVKYQGLYTSGVPRFPIGLRVREDV
jgi:DNA ligase-1